MQDRNWQEIKFKMQYLKMWKINDFYYSTSVQNIKYIAHVFVNFRSFFLHYPIFLYFIEKLEDLHKKTQHIKYQYYSEDDDAIKNGSCNKNTPVMYQPTSFIYLYSTNIFLRITEILCAFRKCGRSFCLTLWDIIPILHEIDVGRQQRTEKLYYTFL